MRASRSTSALALAAVAFLCAAAAALAPARHVRSHYSWPPATLPASQPDRAWYTPMVLTRHEPQAMSAQVPCTLPQPLPSAARPTVVLATARDPSAVGGLLMTLVGRRLHVAIGSATLAQPELPEPESANAACSFRLELAGGQWSLTGPTSSKQTGTIAMPVVDGLFSGLDLKAG